MEAIKFILEAIKNLSGSLNIARMFGANISDTAERAFTIPERDRKAFYKSVGLPEDSWDEGDECFRQIADGLGDLAVLSATKGTVKPD